MIINRAAGWIYVGPPKTGCTTMTGLLQTPAFGGCYSGWMHDRPAQREDVMLFATVRDPYQRAVSMYHHFLFEAVPGRLKVKTKVYPFHRFCAHQLLGRKYPNAFFWATADHWLGPHTYDAYLPLEDLEVSLRALSLHRSEFGVPHRNRTIHGHWRSDYTTRIASMVREWGEPDFARFGYSRELLSRIP